MSIPTEKIKENYEKVLEHINQTAVRIGRDPSEIKVVVVTKTHPVEVIEQLYSIGVRDFGENRVNEGINKKISLLEKVGVQWHMIGHVQSRKSEQIAEHFDVLHSFDRPKLANRLDHFLAEKKKALPVLLQVNVSGEESKSGLSGADESNWDTLLPEIETILSLANLEVSGLMTMAPYDKNPENARPVFRRLRKLRDYLAIKFPKSNWQDLSMGMSADYTVAVQEDATILRIGSEILGSR